VRGAFASGGWTATMAREEERRPGAKVKAVGLLSGGLDSTLAARLLQTQGIEVEGLHFSTGFCKIDHRRAVGRTRDRSDPRRLRHEALRAGADLEAPVEIVDVAEEYLRDVVLRPRHGYGSAMNPCIDCRIFMLRKARRVAQERGAEIVFTGEVLGQRPMSQHRAALDLVAREAGLEGQVLRPLSAHMLPPTEAEREGRVDRARLGGIEGRSRKAQLALARGWGLREFPAPSGGCCFLADPSFARRLRDLVAHRGRDGVHVDDVLFLKVGRHFRLAPDLKVVVARDEAESGFLESRAGDGWTCRVADGRGAVARVEGHPGPDRIEAVGSLAARYSRHRTEPRVEVVLWRATEQTRVRVAPAGDEWLRTLRV
jgi:tRNA-specific 2-thiouridylase